MLVTGSPTLAYIDAIRGVLVADPTLIAQVSGVYGHLSEAAAVNYPYVVLGRRHRDHEGGAMQKAGGRVTVQLDGFSRAKGPLQMHTVLSRVAFLLERRQPFTVAGFACLEGSLTCEFEDVFDEPDEDKPDSRLYHGVQSWTAEIHER